MMAKINSICVKAEIVFFDNAEAFFKFPINNTIRVSIKEKETNYSTPSEISSGKPINKNQIFIADLKFGSDYLNRNIMANDEFLIGVFPIVIGAAKVLENI